MMAAAKETAMAAPSPRAHDHARQARANAALDDRLKEAERLKWQGVYDRAGIKFAGEALEWQIGAPREASRSRNSYAGVFVTEAPGDAQIGDLVVQWAGLAPSRVNQYVRRVMDFGRTCEGQPTAALMLGSVVPRSEWPEALREATAPTMLYAESRFDGDVDHIAIRDGYGNDVFSYIDTSDAALMREGYLEAAIGAAADLGRDDADQGRERRFELRKGTGHGFRQRPCWQLVDDAGNVSDIEARGLLSLRPSKFAEAVLAATRAAYADGMREALASRPGRDTDMDLPAPGM